MVNGCGKKIPSTRTIVVYDGDKVVAEVRTREEIDIFRRKYEENSDPARYETEKGKREERGEGTH